MGGGFRFQTQKKEVVMKCHWATRSEGSGSELEPLRDRCSCKASSVNPLRGLEIRLNRDRPFSTLALVMKAQKESCPTKTSLLTAWHEAAEEYSEAVAALSRQIGVLSKAEYENLSQAAEKARKQSREARAALEAHMRAHGCDGNGEAAA